MGSGYQVIIDDPENKVNVKVNASGELHRGNDQVNSPGFSHYSGYQVIIDVDPENKVNVKVNASGELHRGNDQVNSPGFSHYSEGATVLASTINQRLSLLAPDSLNYGTVCIFRVPEKHRNMNKEAYTPRIVSIGPLHHGESQLQAMEEYKLKYLNSFLTTFKVPLELLAEFVQSQEKLVCGCYEEANIRDKKKLLEATLLDGVFIVELFLKSYFREMREMGDTIFSNHWVSTDVLHDLLLIENQVPLKFLSTLYKAFVFGELRKFLDDNAIEPPSFDELSYQYFSTVGNTRKLELTKDLNRAKHLVEFLAILHKPSHNKRERRSGKERKKLRKKMDFSYCPRATELRAAGVKFQHGTEKCLFEIEFSNGMLRIPQLTVNNLTETFFRNVIAFEQSRYDDKPITSYVILLDNLIDTYKDVELLVEHDIIDNQLGSSEEVAELFNHLYKEFVTDEKEFYFSAHCCELTEYSKDFWHGWISKVTKWYMVLKREYFGNPWSLISVMAAIILLILTVIQTVCSVLQV